MIRLLLAIALSTTISASAANFNVTNGNDSGAGSLRQALADAEAAAGADTITIVTLSEITLTGTELVINSEVEIIGAHSTVSAGGESRVFKVTSSGAGCVTLRGLRITGGFLDGDDGGGIYAGSGVCLVLVDCAVTGNRADVGGGLMTLGAAVSVVNSSVDHNEALENLGGGIYALAATTLTLLNATIAENSTVHGGGGVALANSTATITNCTITDNLADSDDSGAGNGGGIEVGAGSNLTITNTAVTGNQDTPGNDGSGTINPNIAGTGTITTQGQNFIGQNDGVDGVFPAGSPNLNGDYAGTSASPISADLTALQGRRLYYTFPQGSLLKDNGDNTATGEAVDQRGYPRFIGGAIDIGAIEMAFLVVTTDADAGAGSLRDAISIGQTQGYGDVVFDFVGPPAPHTITLTSGQLSVSKLLTMLAPSAANRQVTVSGGGNSRVLQISASSPTEVALRNLAVTEGNAGGILNIGGGLYVSSSNALYVYLDKVTITDCTAGGDGGGIYFLGSTLEARNTTVDGCQSMANGGAIYASGKLTLERVTLSGSLADTGGGLFNHGNATLTNCTISGNEADIAGAAGIHSSSASFAAGTTLSHCTIVSNIGYSAGGIGDDAASYFRVQNTIVAGNTSANGPGPGADLSGTFTSYGHNLIGDGTSGTGFIHGTSGNLVGTGAQPIKAVLGPLADNGGQTLTHVPLPGSPAVEAGDTAASSTLVADQAGRPRRHNTNVDIGAVEYIRQITSLELVDATAAEVHSPLALQPGSIRLHRNSADGNLPIPLILSGAVNPASFTDFVLIVAPPASVSQTASAATVTIPAGQTSVDVAVVPFDDALVEGLERARLLATTDNYGELDAAAPVPGEMQISDNDFRVTNYGNSGANTLRAAIDGINAATTGGTILFNNETGTPHPEVITLTSQLNITGVVDILGPTTTRAGVTLSGGGTTRVLNISPGGRATIRNLTIADGLAAGGGGLAMNGINALVENCLFVENVSTGNGGGISGNNGTLTVTNSTFTNNRANNFGGAVANSAAGGTVTLQHCTVAGNIGDEDNSGSGGGGGLADLTGAANQLRIRSTLVAENVSRSGLGPQLFNAVTSLGYNLVSDNTDAAVLYPAGTPNGNNDYVGTGVTPLDARIGPLRENGGSTMTHALHFGSPALEHGVNTGAPAKDQRDVARPFGAFVDIGAYELRPEPYEYWAAHEFGSAPGSAYEDDFDLDGHVNGAEYVTGSDPTTGSSLPYFTVAVAGDQFDVFVSRSPLATVGTNRIATSPDLVTWTLAPLGNYSAVGIAPGDVNGELVRMRMIMTPGTLRMFARVELLP